MMASSPQAVAQGTGSQVSETSCTIASQITYATLGSLSSGRVVTHPQQVVGHSVLPGQGRHILEQLLQAQRCRPKGRILGVGDGFT